MIRRIATSLGSFELADEEPDALQSAQLMDPVVLLHGFTGSKQSWTDLRTDLKNRRRVISIDLPGHGGTAVNPDLARCSFERCAAAVIEALSAIGVRRFALAGYSMGGRLALYLAIDQPSRVTSLVLESASPGLRDETERRLRATADEELARFIEREGIEAFVSRWQALPLFESLQRLPAQVRERLTNQRRSCSVKGLAGSLRAMGLAMQPWMGGRLSELRMPALIVAGAEDAKFSGIGREMSGSIAGARLAIVDGCGHAPHLDRPAVFNRLVAEFLNP
ncbi:MAG TPA: 2-succinyl-6-hydroxy-2,4-cyclohexadiene-1-carboxylate synthase [Candidatus Binataceae bacterium]|nr:2-succinyl-6-hydroxy-2,4-cyclohexadiene-1-carboxylate synthase [Candidatus Binataceae bacterium]